MGDEARQGRMQTRALGCRLCLIDRTALPPPADALDQGEAGGEARDDEPR